MSPESNSQVSLNLLRAYYPVVEPLQCYLGSILEGARLDEDYLTHDTDALSYRTLLKGAYVANVGVVPRARFKALTPMVHLKEMIERAQVQLLSKAKSSNENVLTAGYRLMNNRQTAFQAGVTNYFVNTTVTALHALQWNELFQRIGEDSMFHLLTETSIFLPLPNGCFCQVTGEPIVHLKPPLRPFHMHIISQNGINKRQAVDSGDGERSKKRLRTSSAKHSVQMQPTLAPDRRSPVDIALVRARFPPKHVLNRLSPSIQKKPKSAQPWVEPDPRKQKENARHLVKYVFPRQFELPNPFVVDKSYAYGHLLPNYFDREDQIKAKGPCKTPNRLKQVLPILDKLIWRHSKCGYKPLLDKLCPSKLKAKQQMPLDSSTILEIMSEHSVVLNSQMPASSGNASFDSHGNTIVARVLTEIREENKNKPRFAEFICSYTEVFRYVMAITKSVIPQEMWGCEKNLKRISDNVKTLITARRYETMTIHNLIQGISTSECDWLSPGGRAIKQARVSVTDSQKRHELLEEFLFWFFDSFLIPLIRTTFYVTESSAFRNRVLYFRQDDWTTLCAPLVERLSATTFEKLDPTDAQELLRQRRLGFSFVRLLPKETGVRPIVNLRRKKPVNGNLLLGRPAQSINQILQAAFQILNYEKENQRPQLGASAFGPNEVYTKLKAFKMRLLSRTTTGILPKLYFVKVDVQACFDTIEQTKLLGILRDLISEDKYVVQRHGQVSTVAGKIRRAYVRKAMPDDDHPHFLSLASKLANVLRNTIFVDQVVYSSAQKQEVLDLLEEHITENLVKIGDDYYRQKVGIPQGSVLSALLCSFFYGDLEKSHLKFTDDPNSVLLRLIDDYLFVTTSPGRARRFLRTMQEGHPEYGCFISRDKTLANFETDDPITFIEPERKSFPWCGYLVNMRDLSITVDYNRFHDSYIKDSLTVETGRRSGIVFTQKMMQLAKSKSHIIFNDLGLNAKHVVLVNICQNFTLCAMKLHQYLQDWGLEIPKSSSFIHKTIRQIIRYTHATIQNKAKNQIARASNARFDIPKTYVLFLGTHAFHSVLSKKFRLYAQLLRPLEMELNLRHYRSLRVRLRRVLKESDLSTVLSF